jgi:NAD-dependent SIR2 family protein deacetylase
MNELGSRDIVLFLGAGFSAKALLPTMEKFGDESNYIRESIKKRGHLKEDFRECAQMYFNAGTTFKDFQTFLKRSWEYKDIQNMEKVFCAAEILKECEKDITLNNRSISPEFIVNQIAIWLWKIYQQCPPINERRNDKIPIAEYSSFIDMVKEHSNRINVLTTNYDLLFEYFILKNKLKCFYPVEASEIKITRSNKNYVSFGRNGDPSDFTLCKLHGSINFFIEKKNSNKLFISSELGDGKDIGKSPNWSNKIPAIFAFDSLSEINKVYGKDYYPAIIPPTYSKLYGYKWLRKMWNSALSALSEAKKIIFIGYSLPDTDGFMKSMIMCANAFSEKKEKKILVVDKKELKKRKDRKEASEIRKRYKKIFPGTGINYIYKGFPESSEKISKFINSDL